MQPIFSDAKVVKSYQIGNYNAALLTQIQSPPPIHYLFMLVVVKDKKTPFFYVTSEVNLMQKEMMQVVAKNHTDMDINQIDSESPFICMFSESGQHINLGQSAEWANIADFSNKALSIVCKELNISEVPVEVPVNTGASNKNSIAWIVLIAVIATFVIYFAK